MWKCPKCGREFKRTNQGHYCGNERLEELQTADSYDSISVTGQSADWIEVLAVFAVKVAGADADAADVATMDADRIVRLKAVFWDMTGIATEVETINHPGSGDDDGWTERNLYITITISGAVVNCAVPSVSAPHSRRSFPPASGSHRRTESRRRYRRPLAAP